jgi:flagellar basal-body rod protein FlgG
MDRGLYIAASGMLAEQTRQDQIANDLANASTPGYKPDRSAQASFGRMMLENRATGGHVGPIDLGTSIATVVIDMTAAPLEQTGDTLDVALDGEGFLAVQTPTGARYTRNGQLVVDPQGRLATATGYPVLDDRGKPVVVGNANDLVIGSDGQVSHQGGKAIATIGVVSLTRPVKQGDTLFAGVPGPRPAQTAVRQGYLEGSGVNPATAMVQMITSLRTYESAQKAIQTIDETIDRGIQAGGA